MRHIRHGGSTIVFILLCFFAFNRSCRAIDAFQQNTESMMQYAKITDRTTIEIKLAQPFARPKMKDFQFEPRIKVRKVEHSGNLIKLTVDPFDLSESYYLNFNKQRIELFPDQVLDVFFSDKPLGCVWDEERTIFRIFAPRAKRVFLVLYETVSDSIGTEHELLKDADGVWELFLPGHYFGKHYCYRIAGPTSATELFDEAKLICDPYSVAVATRNEYLHRGKTLIYDAQKYDWQGDEWLKIEPEDLIIYECHLRDLTAHKSSHAPEDLAGSYHAFNLPGIKGGLEHIKSLGVNAVEFLPIHEFGNIELPYGVRVGGLVNTWNPYERNHWGYMTSHFFAPESYYATGSSLKPGHFLGADGRQVNEFKDVVKACHQNGIAVILDVVYNHVAQYDQNSFKLTDKKYYFRLNDDASFRGTSGCGNDFRTERPMARRIIIDSIEFWMKEYHIDGFRFDLAAMLDWQTIDMIRERAQKINPHVILIAEPWGGGEYEPADFSKHGWSVWNDHFRNGVKGQNPENGHSFIFGRWFNDNHMESLKRYFTGTLAEDGGLFMKKSHSINYLESHDDHTLGDFIRIGLGEVRPHHFIADVNKNAHLTPRQKRINKLAAVILFSSQGSIMIHSGQEFARSKVIAPTLVPDSAVGRIDHNSYNKDNETNWINYDHVDLNKDLVDYYRGLIHLRKTHPALRRTAKSDIQFLNGSNPFALGVLTKRQSSGDRHDLLVLVNGSSDHTASFQLPEGNWSVVVDEHSSNLNRPVSQDVVELGPTTGWILRKDD